MGTLADIPAADKKGNLTRKVKPGLMNYKKVQEYLDMSHDQIYDLRKKDPDLPIIKIGGRLFARQSDIDNWIEAQKQAQHVSIGTKRTQI